MTLRIVQWTTGLVGRNAVKAVLDHPDMELVGAYAWSADKSGQDVGVLAGIDPIGVTATDDVDALIALRPDCVLYMPLQWETDHMVRLLEAGINVVSTANFITGRSYGDEEMARLDAAARRGGVSLHGTGANPGMANTLGLAAAAFCRRVDRISVLESVDATNYASKDTWVSLGFGGPPDAPGLVDKVKARMLVFLDAVEMMAGALDVELEDVRFDVEFATATEDVDLGWMQFPQGTVCGLKGRWSGIAAGRPVIELGLLWRLGYSMEPDWPVERGYVIDVDGVPDVHLRVSAESAELADYGASTADPAVNAVPAVVAAAPGLVTTDRLPLVTARGLVAQTRASTRSA